MRMFIEFKPGTDGRTAEETCRAEGMLGIIYATGPAVPNGGVRVEGEIPGDPEAFRDAVAARMPGTVEFAGRAS